MTLDDSETLALCKDWCTCGNPDPLREEHAHDCLFVNFPLEIMQEVENELTPDKEKKGEDQD